ncbi:MAG: glucodextranase DOMON-like domain-containing protein, partial [Myxococcales bacterium]
MRCLPMLLLCATAATASPVEIASFDDAAGDATGPGSYVPPGDGEFTEGDFDLRRFAVYSDGDAVLFEVTLGAPIRRPSITQRTNASEIQLWNGIYLQNIDIYVDTDRASAAGYTACIPG